MGDFRNRFFSTRSRLRPKYFSSGSSGSRRTQRHGLSINIPATQSEAVEIVDNCESSTLRMMHPSEATWSLSHMHPRLPFSASTPTHGAENPFLLPIWTRAGHDSLSLEGRNIGESTNEVLFHNGQAISLSTPLMVTNVARASQSLGSIGFDDPVNGLIGGGGRAIAASDINRFSQALPSYSCTQLPGTLVYPNSMMQRYTADHFNDNDLMYEANPVPNYAAITSSGSNKRKFSALECPVNVAPNISTHTSMAQIDIPLTSILDGLRLPSSEEPHVYQGSGFPRNVPNSWESLRGRHFPETQIESLAPQVQLWMSGHRQEGAPIANMNFTGARVADSIPSIDQLSGCKYGGIRSSTLNQGTRSEVLRVPGNETDDSYLTFRHGQAIVSNRTFSEEARRVGSSQSFTGNSSESRTLINPEFCSIASVSALPEVPSNDLNGRRAFCLTRTQNMQLNHPPIPSTIRLPSAVPRSNRVILPTFGGTHSTSDLLQASVADSIFEHSGDNFLSAAGRTPVGFPFRRVYRPHHSYNHFHRDISNGVAERTPTIQHYPRVEESTYEQLLMLDTTVLFGNNELQDQHSDWRLDVDNMSYEELLALEERMGNVCTGVSEESISKKLKTVKYSSQHETASALPENELKCSVCQEEYENGDDLGSLKCGHSYHAVCIKQWLVKKNQCPVCKASAFSG